MNEIILINSIKFILLGISAIFCATAIVKQEKWIVLLPLGLGLLGVGILI